MTTPESYLGSARADRFANGLILPGVRDFGEPEEPEQDGLSYGGRWNVSADYATAEGGRAGSCEFGAKRVFLVLASPGRPRKVALRLDGKPIAVEDAGRDVERFDGHGGRRAAIRTRRSAGGRQATFWS